MIREAAALRSLLSVGMVAGVYSARYFSGCCCLSMSWSDGFCCQSSRFSYVNSNGSKWKESKGLTHPQVSSSNSSQQWLCFSRNSCSCSPFSCSEMEKYHPELRHLPSINSLPQPRQRRYILLCAIVIQIQGTYNRLLVYWYLPMIHSNNKKYSSSSIPLRSSYSLVYH